MQLAKTQPVKTDSMISLPAQDYVKLANHYYMHNTPLVSRLYMSIPYTIGIPDPMNGKIIKFKKPWECKTIYDFMEGVKDPVENRLLKQHIVRLIAFRLQEELGNKKIPQEVFEKGAISFGFCEQIAYWGQYYLDMCDMRARDLGLETISWREVDVKIYVNDLDKILEAQSTLDISLENRVNITSINPRRVANWPAGMDLRPVLYDRRHFPFAITSSEATYKGVTAYWDLDFCTLKLEFRDEKNTKPPALGNAIAKRPVQIATIKAQKELAKKFHARDLSQINILDAGEDSPEFHISILERDGQPQEKLVNAPELNAKMNFVDEMLSRDF